MQGLGNFQQPKPFSIGSVQAPYVAPIFGQNNQSFFGANPNISNSLIGEFSGKPTQSTIPAANLNSDPFAANLFGNAKANQKQNENLAAAPIAFNDRMAGNQNNQSNPFDVNLGFKLKANFPCSQTMSQSISGNLAKLEESSFNEQKLVLKFEEKASLQTNFSGIDYDKMILTKYNIYDFCD